MKQLRSFLESLFPISDEEFEYIAALFIAENYKAKEAIVRTNQIAKSVYLIEKGLLRTYHLIDGKEINTYFACDGQFISTFASFIQQKPSIETLEAIEDTMVYSLSKEALESAYLKYPKFEKLGRYMAEQNYLCVTERTLVMQTKTGREKYLHFLENNALKIVQRVPQHHIASFLGLAPESLSRIRKEIVRS